MAVILLAATGCTICPDPFDYSGPVPDCSAPQNDFRARANGILPLGGTPRPWPPIVQAAPESDDESRPALAAAEERADEDEAALDDAVTVQAAATEADADENATTLELPEVAEPTLDEILPPAAPARRPILPPLRETPGWRPRS